MSISEMLTEWAAKPSGFVFIDTLGNWLNTQATAVAYLGDVRRREDPYAWEASAERFMQSVAGASRWCMDPDEVEMLGDVQPVIPMPLPWENAVTFRPQRRSA